MAAMHHRPRRARRCASAGAGLALALLAAFAPARAEDPKDPRLDNGVHFYDHRYCNCRVVDPREVELTGSGAVVFGGTAGEETYACVAPSPDGKTSYRCLGVEDDVLNYAGRCLLHGADKGT